MPHSAAERSGALADRPGASADRPGASADRPGAPTERRGAPAGRSLGLRERKREQTWRLLRATALQLVGERGFDEVSVDEIASGAAVAKRTFFNYFASKEAVLLDPDPDEPAVWRSLLEARPAAEDPWVSLREVLLAYTKLYETKLVAYKRMADASPTLARSSRDTTHEFWTLIHAWAVERVGTRGVAAQLRAELLTACARTVLRAAMASWRPEAGVHRLHRLIRAGFDQVGAGLAQGPGRQFS